MFNHNVIEYCTTGHIGNCPKCNTTLKVEKYETPIRDNLMVRCPKCNAEEYFTGKPKK